MALIKYVISLLVDMKIQSLLFGTSEKSISGVQQCIEVVISVNFFFSLPYFFDYKMGVFSFQNNPKDLDPSCKTDLDLLGLFRNGKN